MERPETMVDATRLIDDYILRKDWRVKENSTITYSIGGLVNTNSGAVTANYWLNNVYPPEIAEAHRKADIHIHDISMLTAYCAGWNLKQLIEEALAIHEHRLVQSVERRPVPRPPRRCGRAEGAVSGWRDGQSG